MRCSQLRLATMLVYAYVRVIMTGRWHHSRWANQSDPDPRRTSRLQIVILNTHKVSESWVRPTRTDAPTASLLVGRGPTPGRLHIKSPCHMHALPALQRRGQQS